MITVNAPLDRIAELAGISIAFEVKSVMDVRPAGEGRFQLLERELPTPWTKDYDAIAGNRPADWLREFDTRNWGLILAEAESAVWGAALLAFDTPGVEMLEGRRDLAVLWDLRVQPDRRVRGVGGSLFRAAEAWARFRGASELKVETQDINVPAVKFYLKLGCQLRRAIPGAYEGCPDEVKLLFYKALGA